MLNSNIKSNQDKNSIIPNAIVDLGRTKILFAQTFMNQDDLIKALKKEKEGEKYMAMYVPDPHILVAKAPDLLFINPSYVYRFDLSQIELPKREPFYPIRLLATAKDAERVNEIYRECNMLPQPAEKILENQRTNKVKYFVAMNKQKKVIGTVTAIDHFQAFGDLENGSSLWNLAVGVGYRRKGVGKALVKWVMKHFYTKARSFLDLSVIYNNKKAMEFYRRLGFKRTDYFVVKRKNALNRHLYTKEK